jgi:hypothetical protein
MIIQRNNLRRLYEQPVLVFALSSTKFKKRYEISSPTYLEIFYTLYSTVVFYLWVHPI